MARWQAAARKAAPTWTRRAFRDALLGGFDRALAGREPRIEGAPYWSALRRLGDVLLCTPLIRSRGAPAGRHDRPRVCRPPAFTSRR